MVLGTNPAQVDHSVGWALIVIGVVVILVGGGFGLFLSRRPPDPAVQRASADRGSVSNVGDGNVIINVHRPEMELAQNEASDSPLRELGAKARVVCDEDYDGGSAIYVVLDVSNPNADVVTNARARLVCVTPIAERADYLATLPQFQFEEDLLQWSSAFGGAEVTTFKTRATLDVLAFENNDQWALIVYSLPSIRSKRELLLEAADWWEIEIEVYAESGHHGSSRFRIRRGGDKVCVAASRNGTLYEPELEERGVVVPCSIV